MWQHCAFLHLLLQPFITGLHKITIEEGKVNMDSLTNSAKDIATFHKLMSEAILCHATATSLFHRIFIFFNLKLGKPKLHTTCMRKIYSAVQHSPQEIDQMKRYCILTVIFCFHFLRIKLSK